MMLALLFQLAAAAPDTLRPVPSPLAVEQQDTTRRRARAVDVSEWYSRRLTIHRVASYTMLPVFAMQYYAGNKLYEESTRGIPAPSWARPVHKVGASSVAAIFGVNTVTGLWNLWDSRHVEQNRWLRTSHALAMLGADAAFAYTGIKLSQDAKTNFDDRKAHRRVALFAIGLSVGSGVAMKVFNR